MNSGSTRVWADGLIAGAIGYAVAVIFFVVLDLITGRSWLFTATLLGEGLFYGLEDPVQLVPAYGPAIAFNGVHLIGYLAMGVIAAWLAARAEQGAQFWYVATVLFVFGLFHVIAAMVWLTEPLRAALSVWKVIAATFLAVTAMVAYLVHAHPRLRERQGYRD